MARRRRSKFSFSILNDSRIHFTILFVVFFMITESAANWQYWSKWTPCNKDCNGGTQMRNRTCYSNNCTGPSNQTRKCNTQYCEENCFKALDPSDATRTQKCCYFPNTAFSINTVSFYNSCFPTPNCTFTCPLDKNATKFGTCVNGTVHQPWTAWSNCSHPCFTGVQNRSRRVISVSYTTLILSSESTEVQTRYCNQKYCLYPLHKTIAEFNGSQDNYCFFNESRSGGAGSSTVFSDCQHNSTSQNHWCYLDRFGLNKGICVKIDGNFTEWSQWSSCNETCFTGVRRRTRNCTNPAPKYGGKCHGSLEEKEFCNNHSCHNISSCTKATFGGLTTCCMLNMTRQDGSYHTECVYNGTDFTCPLDRYGLRYGKCEPIDGNFSEWGSWSNCSYPCFYGIKRRERTCDNPPPKYNGTCHGNPKNWTFCNEQPCYDLANCTNATFEGIKHCCAFGIPVRQRNSPLENGTSFETMHICENDGSNWICPIDRYYTRVGVCEPINKVLSNWGEFGPCQKKGTCKVQIQTRNRTCTDGKYKGTMCNHTNEEKEDARNCTMDYCPPDTKWSEWSNPSECSVTCGKGFQTYSRYCQNNDNEQIMDSECEGDAIKKVNCTRKPCPGFILGSPGLNCSAACQTINLTCHWYSNSDVTNYASQFQSVGVSCEGLAPLQRQWKESWQPAYITTSRGCVGYVDVNAKEITCQQHVPLNNTVQRLCHCIYKEDLVYTEWSAWSKCSSNCGNAYKTRQRRCLAGQESCSGALDQNTTCDLPTCPDDLGFTSWTDWSKCSKKCNLGSKNRSRMCNDESLCFGHKFESKSCNTEPCKVHGHWSTWSSWSLCSKSCGGGTTLKSRTCTNPAPLHGGNTCNRTEAGENVTLTCNTFHCSGIYLAENRRQCNETCLSKQLTCIPHIETKNKTDVFSNLGLICDYYSENAVWRLPYHPSYNRYKKECMGYDIVPETLSCEDQVGIPTNVSRLCNCQNGSDIGYNEWSNWGECSKTCGMGTRSRFRSCKQDCYGPSTDTGPCLIKNCPVNGGWSDFTDWSVCSQSCGGGKRYRYRQCTNPEPAFGGLDCDGKSSIEEGCNFEICPIHGMWGQWGEWSLCNKPCNNGTAEKVRFCDSPKPQFNGMDCRGERKRARLCNSHPCKPVGLGVQVVFHNETFNNRLFNESTDEFKALERKIYNNVINLYGVEKNHVLTVKVTFFLPGSVVANFTIKYTEITRFELVTLLTSLQENQLLNTMPISKFTIKTDDIPSSSGSVVCRAMSESIIHIDISSFREKMNSYSVIGYSITYRQTRNTSESAWSSFIVSNTTLTTNLTRLQPYTVYTIRVVAITHDATGVPSNLTDISTLEGAPTKPPTNAVCTATSATSIYCEWLAVPYDAQNGIITHYTISYRVYSSPNNLINNDKSWSVVRLSATALFAKIDGLKPYTRYEVRISAATSAGDGPVHWQSLATDEDVPSKAPLNVKGVSHESFMYVDFFWEPIPEDSWNGKPVSLKLTYSVSRKGSQAIIGGASTTVNLRSDRRRYRVTGLESNWQIQMTIQGVTSAGDGVRSPMTTAETCLCSESLYFAWYEKNPYVFKRSEDIVGVFPDFFSSMISTICGTCKAYSKSTIYFDRTKTGHSALRSSERDLKDQVSDSVHFHAPIAGKKDITIFEGQYQYVNLIDGTMSAFVVVDPAKTSKTNEISGSIMQCWPILVVVILMTVLAGILIWMADQFANPEEMPTGRFLYGTFQGFWWAFVSMTTVGYGDISPRGSLARSLAITWTAIGLIVNGILVSSLSTALTVVTVSQQTLLYGANVSAVHKSPEYYLGIRRNANLTSTGKTFNTSKQALDALVRREVQGALLEFNEAANLQSYITANDLKIAKTIKSTSGIGFVLSGSMASFHTQIRSYVAGNYDRIQALTKNYTKEVTIPTVKKASGDVSGLFDQRSPVFQELLNTTIVVLVAAIVLGIAWNFVGRKYLRRLNRVRPGRSTNDAIRDNYNQRSTELIEIVEDFVKNVDEVDKLSEKQGFDRFRLLLKHFDTLPFGLPMWLRYGTTDDRYILAKIRVEEAFLENLNKKKKRSTKGNLELVDVFGNENQEMKSD